ncbi:3-keto-disaccharide hydrolase [Pararhodonellum marinum]|uniref:3-keto-disaccharide hydrolase n=1 Tax=Pararhodonellum marinum TaxID=2755358 RepID=UPI00188E127E|nr:DUF1080 domain-containing protein [Pararhodonellum marinum]
MKTYLSIGLMLLFSTVVLAQKKSDKDGWISLFDGKSLEGWTISENPESFSLEDGVLKVQGDRAHLFYVGEVENHDFKNFEFKADVKTMEGANSGIFFHTEFQDDGWPEKGYEVQVNQTHSDWRKTGSLYSFNDVREVHVKDGKWYNQHIIVQGDHVTVKINGKTVMEYKESEDTNRTGDLGSKKLDRGTFALQAHDPESIVYFKNIMVKPLPD